MNFLLFSQPADNLGNISFTNIEKLNLIRW